MQISTSLVNLRFEILQMKYKDILINYLASYYMIYILENIQIENHYEIMYIYNHNYRNMIFTSKEVTREIE